MSNPTDTGRINLLECKLNSDVTRFFLSIFFVAIQRPNAMVGNDDDRPEVSLLFFVRRLQYLPHVEKS
jgi:hypothetical protein